MFLTKYLDPAFSINITNESEDLNLHFHTVMKYCLNIHVIETMYQNRLPTKS